MDIFNKMQDLLLDANMLPQQKEEVLIDYLNTLDYSQIQVREDTYKAASLIVKYSIESNSPLPKYYAKALHYMITKNSLAEAGISSIVINYEKTPSDPKINHTAFYRQDDNSITFLEERTHNQEKLISNAPDSDSRLILLCNIIMVINHEIQHAIQNVERESTIQNPEKLTPTNYTMQLQDIARTLSDLYKKHNKTKYLYNEDLLYSKLNHDNFLIELDSDIVGITKMFEILPKISERAYELASYPKSKNFLDIKKEKESIIKDYQNVTWTHSTNVNQGPINACYKTSMIIDNILPHLSPKFRESYLQDYPALRIVWNDDGKRKTLQEVESEWLNKKNTVQKDSTLSSEEKQTKSKKIDEIYSRAIEQDCLFSFEKRLQSILHLHHSQGTINAQGYYTPPVQGTKKLTEAKEHAKLIASYMEDSDNIIAINLLDKYRKLIINEHGPIRTPEDARLQDYKSFAINEISGAFYKNVEYRNAKEQEIATRRLEQEKAIKQQEDALNLLKKVFPDLSPTPTFLVAGETKTEKKPNTKEKLEVLLALDDYRKVTTNIPKDNSFIPLNNIRNAIKTVYNFEVSQEEQTAFAEMLKKNPDYPRLKNMYTSPKTPHQFQDNDEMLI